MTANVDASTVNDDLSPAEAMAKFGDAGMDHYQVNPRGRPARSVEEAAEREVRLHRFGAYLRKLREDVDLSPRDVARMTGISSPRKLTQYETNCYPPGEIVLALAKCYGILSHDLARTMLAHSDPALHLALTGDAGVAVTPEDIAAKIRANADRAPTPTRAKRNTKKAKA